MDGWMNEQKINVLTDKWIDKWMDRWINDQMNRWRKGETEALVGNELVTKQMNINLKFRVWHDRVLNSHTQNRVWSRPRVSVK